MNRRRRGLLFLVATTVFLLASSSRAQETPDLGNLKKEVAALETKLKELTNQLQGLVQGSTAATTTASTPPAALTNPAPPDRIDQGPQPTVNPSLQPTAVVNKEETIAAAEHRTAGLVSALGISLAPPKTYAQLRRDRGEVASNWIALDPLPQRQKQSRDGFSPMPPVTCTSIPVPGGVTEWCVSSPPRGMSQEMRAACSLMMSSGCHAILSQVPEPVKVAPAKDDPIQRCPKDCGGVGRCDYLTGTCRCPQGATGPDCSQEMPRGCSKSFTHYHDGNRSVPHRTHITPWEEPGLLTLTCNGACDQATGMCYCPSYTKYGRIEAPPGSPPGTPPIREGRPLQGCKVWFTHPVTGAKSPSVEAGKPPGVPTEDIVGFGRNAPVEVAFPDEGKQLHPMHFVLRWRASKKVLTQEEIDRLDLTDPVVGWCNADPNKANQRPVRQCVCAPPHFEGRYCSEVTPALCMNQCGGNGICREGFCHCKEGYLGPDCIYKLEQADAMGLAKVAVPPLPEVVRSVVKSPFESVDRGTGKASVKRPLIFVYDLDPIYNELMLAYRNDYHLVREFRDKSVQNHLGKIYTLEQELYEMLLQSPHRTLNPDEADFFYVPTFMTLYIFPVLGATDFPWFEGPNGEIAGPFGVRSFHASRMQLQAKRFIQRTYPFWNRTLGHDHIFAFFHDEGACYAPPEIYENATILTFWGRLDLEHTSHGYLGDFYSHKETHPHIAPRGQQGELGVRQPCFAPSKDILLPNVWREPNTPFLGLDTSPKTRLASFSGRVLDRTPLYSRGIRQNLTEIASRHGWWQNFRISYNEPRDRAPPETKFLQSVFCLVIPGDGWTTRFEDYVRHGCVPVVIQDTVWEKFEGEIDVSAFTFRVKESEIAHIPKILMAIRPQRVRLAQRKMASVTSRYYWLKLPADYKLAKESRQRMLLAKMKSTDPAKAEEANAAFRKWAAASDQAEWERVVQEAGLALEEADKLNLLEVMKHPVLGKYLQGAPPLYHDPAGDQDAFDTLIQALVGKARARGVVKHGRW